MRLHPGIAKAKQVAEAQAMRDEANAHTLGEAEAVAHGAERVLSSKAMKDAFARLEAAYLSEWRASQVSAAGERERIFLRLRALDELKADLETASAGGRLTARNLRLT
jgi:hypothetical protein